MPLSSEFSCFNSTMVRLKDLAGYVGRAMFPGFNSTMVRLKEDLHFNICRPE